MKMFRRFRITNISTILFLLFANPIFAHESYSHFLGYIHEAKNVSHLASIIIILTTLVFIVTLWTKKEKNK
tara:strand:+ start:7331 stop:7543 length:213 start_codon:yes stop_codon:yes gene_type:complete